VPASEYEASSAAGMEAEPSAAKAAAGGPWDAANGHGEDMFRSVLARAGMHLPAADARVCCEPAATASTGEFV